MADNAEVNIFARSGDGYPIHFKLTGATVYRDAVQLLGQLKADGFTPGTAPGRNGQRSARPSAPAGPMCHQHGVPFRQYQKDGRTWFAHRQGDGWCRQQALTAVK